MKFHESQWYIQGVFLMVTITNLNNSANGQSIDLKFPKGISQEPRARIRNISEFQLLLAESCPQIGNVVPAVGIVQVKNSNLKKITETCRFGVILLKR